MLAISAGSSVVGEIVQLQGTPASPHTEDDFDETSAKLEYEFQSDGDVRVDVSGGSDFFIQDWVVPKPPSGTYWIRATWQNGDVPTIGDTLNVWHSLASLKDWGWTQSGDGNTGGEIKIEIATDSGGVNIVATGYYVGDAEVESGA